MLDSHADYKYLTGHVVCFSNLLKVFPVVSSNTRQMEDFQVEIESLPVVEESNQNTCDKNPRHEDYIPYKDLTKEHLYPYDDSDLLAYIKYMGSRAVRVRVYEDNIHKENATGFICKRDEQTYVVTNSHVIKSEIHAKNCKIDFNFHSDDEKDMITTTGTRIRFQDPCRDYCQLYFNVEPVRHIINKIVDLWNYNVWVKFPGATEEEKFYILMMEGEIVLQTTYLLGEDRLPDEPLTVRFNDKSECKITSFYRRTRFYDYLSFQPIPQWLEDNKHVLLPVVNPEGEHDVIVVTVSHPHGKYKQVSIGNEEKLEKNDYVLYHSAMTCGGSSGAPTFRLGLKDIGKFPRIMLYTHYEGTTITKVQKNNAIRINYNRAHLNTRRENKS